MDETVPPDAAIHSERQVGCKIGASKLIVDCPSVNLRGCVGGGLKWRF